MRLLLFLVLLVFPTLVSAKYDPLSVSNNKFGIHIADVNDLPDVPSLVNSTGGDWGYITLVIQEDDRDPGKWQQVFNRMRRLHLIPIIRLATRIDGDAWIKPQLSDAEAWTNFLNSLNWPIENRYIVIFNEPNHAKEWGRSVNPEEYAKVLVEFAKILKEAADDFFILPAGLDVSTVSDGQSLEAASFWRRMVGAKPEVLELIDGWTSHSYPNPGFSGSPLAWGRGTLRSYLWELSYLRNLGLSKNLPVFITETGWLHNQGVIFNPGLLSSESVGDNLAIAAATVWQDPNIVAVTPFIFSYQGLPFDHFSWKKLGSNEIYPHTEVYRALKKRAGRPRQRLSFEIPEPILPETLVASGSYNLKGLIKNIGQAIVDPKEGDKLLLESGDGEFVAVFDPLPLLEPGESGELGLHLKAPTRPGTYGARLLLRHYDQDTIIESRNIGIVPPPSLNLRVQLGWRGSSNAGEATVLLYDHETLLAKFTGVRLVTGKASVTGLTNVVPGQKYRVVILLPYYLPRQNIVSLKATNTQVAFKRMLPVDFNGDGALTAADILALFFTKPHEVIRRFLGP